MPLDEKQISALVSDWYSALDQHAPLDEVKEFLVREGLEMKFPEATTHGQAGFAEWYATVTRRFFDEVHAVTKVDSTITGDQATVKVLVNWQAKIWDPPEAKSKWLGFDADQTWVVVPGPAGAGVQIKTYVVNDLAPMPGSHSL